MNFKLSLLALLGAEALANALALAPSPSLNTPAVVSTSSAESVALAKLFPASRVNETRIFTAAAAAVAGNSGFQASCRDIRFVHTHFFSILGSPAAFLRRVFQIHPFTSYKKKQNKITADCPLCVVA
jgi:hypothetical protein